MQDGLMTMQAYIIATGETAIRMAVDEILLSHLDDTDKLKQIHEVLRDHYYGNKQNRGNNPACAGES